MKNRKEKTKNENFLSGKNNLLKLLIHAVNLKITES